MLIAKTIAAGLLTLLCVACFLCLAGYIVSLVVPFEGEPTEEAKSDERRRYLSDYADPDDYQLPDGGFYTTTGRPRRKR